jgi:Divergent InlB B-repeat domain/Abnormal spindle-like microcephaly-assoc'd, ASPM-SPD-2-Hydin
MIRYFVLALAVGPLAISPTCSFKFPNVQLSPASVTFAPQVVNPASPAGPSQTVTVRNSGTAALSLTAFVSSGDFSQTNDCPVPPAKLAAGGTCTMQVTFSPNVVGEIKGAVTITDTGIGTPHVLALSGTGLPPVGFSPASLDFASVAVNTTGATKSVTLTNNQSVALNINGITASGNYNVPTHTCSSPLEAGQSCTINVNFHPTFAGAVAGALTVSTDASPGTQPVALTGSGSGSASSNVDLSPATLAFGNHEAGTLTGGKTVTLTNNGGSSLSIQSIKVSGGYESSDTCSGSVAAGGSCTITLKFHPSADFANVDYPGALTIFDSDSTSPQVVALSGTGVQPVIASPAAVDFGTFDTDSAPGTQSVTITNVHTTAENLAVTSSGHFDLSSNNCPPSLGAGNHCSASATFSFANRPGPQTGAMTISPSSTGFLTPTVVSLSACATQVLVSPRSFDFGAVAVGSTGTAHTTIANTGPDMNISGISITGTNSGDFTISNNTCGTTLVSSDACTLDVTYAPQASGSRSAALSVSDDGACSPQQQILKGGSSAGPFRLYITNTGADGIGSVASNPPGTDCGTANGATCLSFSSGTSVTLTAAPDPSSHFLDWSGACTGSSACTLDMDSDKQVTVDFKFNPILSVQFGGNGTGKINGTPGGIDCPATACAAQVAPGTTITLNATADPNSTFKGWSGAGCSGTGTCTVTLNSDQTVTATFTAPDFELSASAVAPSTVQAGKGAMSTVTLTSVNGFSSVVTFTCSVDPSPRFAPTCSLNPATATPAANGSANSTLSISTTAPSSSAMSRVSRTILYALWLPIGGLLWAGIGTAPIGKRRFLLFGVTCVLLAGVVLETACGGSSVKPPPTGGTPPGPYTITVTGTAGSTQHSATTPLTVQ